MKSLMHRAAIPRTKPSKHQEVIPLIQARASTDRIPGATHKATTTNSKPSQIEILACRAIDDHALLLSFVCTASSS